MQYKKLSLSVITAGIVTLTICGAALVALLSLYNLTDRSAGVSATIFAAINLLILSAMVPIGSNGPSFVSSVQLWSVTIVYSVVQFVTLFLAADVWGNTAYTLFQLVVLALWFGIAMAAIITGRRGLNEEDNVL